MDRLIIDDILVFAGLMTTLGVIAKITLTFAQRRRGLAGADDRTLGEIAARLARLEQLAESTALEVERIGEGQRFTTKLLGEKSDAKLS
ncbi:MAG: hypothetical protein HY084_09950 [Gemmatimonadetes bacterium]|nr:hypothetical protein [Gemmatimonadota bacterium]